MVKEESVEFEREECENVQILGSWVGDRVDVRNRLRRSNQKWAKVKKRLQGTSLSKRWQARVVEA